MIERHVSFDVYPDKKADFEKVFVDEYRPAMASIRGFVRVELLCRSDEPGKYQMLIRFENAEAASDWRNSAAHQALQPRLKALYSQSTLTVYDVIA